MRTTLADRPGALAQLTQRCGDEGINILGLQIFPGVEAVTDELVLSVPDGWRLADVAALVESAGGRAVTVSTCTAHALVDGPTNYLLAVRHVVEDPSSIEEALTELLDGEAAAEAEQAAAVLPALEVPVGDLTVTVRRAAPFTATEEARATAFAMVAGDLLAARAAAARLPGERLVTVPDAMDEQVFRVATAGDALALVRMGERCSTRTLAGRFGAPLSGFPHRLARQLLTEGPALAVQVGHEVVGLATLTNGHSAEVGLFVEDGWQRRGIGTRLLTLAARLAKARGAQELVLLGRRDDDVVPGLAAASGLTGRMRHVNGRVMLTVSLRRVAPLLQNVEGLAGLPPLDPAPA